MRRLRDKREILKTKSQDLRRTLIKSGMRPSDARRATTVSPIEINPIISHPVIDNAFGRIRSGHIYWYLNQVISQRSSVGDNDFLDLMHMMYAYDCDIFCCDKKMFHLMDGFEPFAGKLIYDASQLPATVDAHLRDVKH